MNHRIVASWRVVVRRFIRSDAGAVAPLIGLIALVLIGCMGIAVDLGRAVVVRARLYDALDSAGLAVATRVSTVDATAEAKKFVAANFAANFAGATVTNVTATPNADKSVIALTATATMPTAFMQLFGQKLVTVGAASEVTRKLTGLEVVMVLDNTGSMENSGSMPSLRSAANLLVDQLFGSSTTAKNLYVGLVPFSQAVNIGTSATRTATWVKSTSLASTSRPNYPAYWTGCVEARQNGLDQTDDPPLAVLSAGVNSLFTAYYSPDSSTNNWISNRGAVQNINYNGTSQTGPGAYCPSEVTPMTNVKSKITAGVAAMKPGGSTLINVGAIWGWRMLSPRWRGYWDGDMAANLLPLDYSTKNMQKAVVLMTDGENSLNASNYTAYALPSDNRLGTTSTSGGEAVLDTRLAAACTSMKAKGIIVYTVAFNNPEPATKTLLQNCATGTSYSFDATDEAALKASFQKIGDSLSNLRVSK